MVLQQYFSLSNDSTLVKSIIEYDSTGTGICILLSLRHPSEVILLVAESIHALTNYTRTRCKKQLGTSLR
jgi:hypothetical protein